MDAVELRERAIGRFWEKVDKAGPTRVLELGPCWLWLGTLYGNFQYPRMWDGYRTLGGHRFSWELQCGPVPDGQLVLHKCDTPACTNPQHLFLGTVLDNVRDRDLKGRTCQGAKQWQRAHPERRMFGDRNPSRLHPEKLKRGEANPRSKLTEQLVRRIREMRMDGFTQGEIAKSVGVCQTAVSSVVLGKTWRHVI